MPLDKMSPGEHPWLYRYTYKPRAFTLAVCSGSCVVGPVQITSARYKQTFGLLTMNNKKLNHALAYNFC